MGQTSFRVAVVGATGAVGREMVAVLEQRNFPVSELVPLASERSAGSMIEFHGEEVVVQKLDEDSFDGIDIALFSAGGSISEKFGPIAERAGSVVIDNSSFFRMHENISLIVPEVNGAELRKKLSERKEGEGIIVSNPNCSTIQMVVVLKPLHEHAGLKRVVVSTYQSVSGAGQQGLDELWQQCLAIFNQKQIVNEKFPHQIAFNCLPHIDSFLDNGYTKEEMKLVKESQKILGIPTLPVTATAVRVPVFSCHSESVNIEFEKPLSPEQVREVLRESPGVVVLDDPKNNQYPLSITTAGTDATYVGRIRKDESIDNGINLWIVADNLRKGAALNAVQIAEIVLEERPAKVH